MGGVPSHYESLALRLESLRFILKFRKTCDAGQERKQTHCGCGPEYGLPVEIHNVYVICTDEGYAALTECLYRSDPCGYDPPLIFVVHCPSYLTGSERSSPPSSYSLWTRPLPSRSLYASYSSKMSSYSSASMYPCS